MVILVVIVKTILFPLATVNLKTNVLGVVSSHVDLDLYGCREEDLKFISYIALYIHMTHWGGQFGA